MLFEPSRVSTALPEATSSNTRPDRPYDWRQLAVRTFWLLPLGFYLLTVSRTPGWVDAPLLARFVHDVELSTWVNHHNLFTLLGAGWLWLTPSNADPHASLNVLCAVLGAATVYVVFRIGLRLTHNLVASVLGSLALMVSHSLWWHSTMLEVYTLSTLLLSLTVLFIVRYDDDRGVLDLCAAAFTFGLAASNHPQMGLLGLGFVGLGLAPETRGELLRPFRLLTLLGCFFLGFQAYAWVFLAEFVRHMQSSPLAEPLAVLTIMLDRTTGADFKQFMFPSGLTWGQRFFWWGFYAALFVYNFVPPWVFFAPVGFVGWMREPRHRASFLFVALALAAQVVWSANYLVWDMYAFALPAYVLTAILIVVGLDRVYRRGGRSRLAVLALSPTLILVPVLYAWTPSWLANSGAAQAALGRLPQYTQATAFWNPLEYFFNPNKRLYDRVDRTANTLLAELAPNACFWGNEATVFYPLVYYYQGVLGRRPDVKSHLVFGITGTEEAFRRDAEVMAQELSTGCPVYVASVGYPERHVLNLVAAELDAERDLTAISRLPKEEFLDSFPGYTWRFVEIDAATGTGVYRADQSGSLRPP